MGLIFKSGSFFLPDPSPAFPLKFVDLSKVSVNDHVQPGNMAHIAVYAAHLDCSAVCGAAYV